MHALTALAKIQEDSFGPISEDLRRFLVAAEAAFVRMSRPASILALAQLYFTVAPPSRIHVLLKPLTKVMSLNPASEQPLLYICASKLLLALLHSCESNEKVKDGFCTLESVKRYMLRSNDPVFV